MFKKNRSIWLALDFLLMAIFSFINLKLNFLTFGTNDFAIWLLLSSFWGFGTSIDFGISFSLIKFISTKRDENNDHKEISQIVTTSLFMFMILGLLMFSILCFIGYHLYLNNPSTNVNGINVSYLFFIISLTFIFKYLSLFLKSIFEGFNRYILTSKISVFQNIAIFILTCSVFLLKLDLTALGKGYLFISIFILITYIIIFFMTLPFVQIRHQNFRLLLLKKILSHSISIQMMNISGALIDPAFKYCIGNYYKLEYVSIYELARRFVTLISGLFSTSFRYLLNDISSLNSYNEKRSFILINCTQISYFGVVFSGVFVGIGGLAITIVLKLFFGYDSALTIFLILCLCEVINNYAYPVYFFLAGTNYAWLLAITQFINLIISTLFLVIGLLSLKNSYGFMGMFVAVVLLNLFLLFFTAKVYNFSLKEYLLNTKFYKLALLLLLLFLASLFNSFNDLLIMSIISIINLLIFRKDIINLISNFNSRKSVLFVKNGNG